MQRVRQALGVASVFFLIGLGLLVAATHQFFSTRSFVLTADSARGRVVELAHGGGGSGKSRTSCFAAVFTFKDASGKVHTVREAFAQNPPTHQVGDEVSVLYHRSSPAEALIRGFRTLWISPTILAAIGGCFAIIGATAFFASRKTLSSPDRDVAA